VDPNNEDTIYATYGGFGSSCPAGGPGCQHVFKSTDRGTTWTDISATLPNAPFESIITVHPKNTGCPSCMSAALLVAGSDVGVFVSADAGATWSQLGDNLPYTEVDQVFADKNGSYIYAATHGRGMWRIAAPYLGKGTVYVASTDGYLYAISGKTGAILWRYQVGANESQPAVANGLVYDWQYLGNPIKLLALKASTGALAWSYTFPTGEQVATGVVAANGNIFIGVYGAGSPLLEAFNGTTGAPLWTYNTGVQSQWLVTTVPTVANGAVYLGVHDSGDQNHDGYLIAVNATTGVLLWRTLLGDIQTTVAVDSTQVYVNASPYSGLNPFLYALNVTTGAIDWSVQLADLYSSPAVANGTVYVEGAYYDTCSANGDCLFALNAANGALVWRFQMATGGNEPAPAVANGMVYFGTPDGKVAAVDATTGTLSWQYQTAANTEDAAVANGVVYIGTNDGYIHALNASNGVPNWELLTNSYYYPRPVVGP
jgi:outer membrane protein assembly factor BamB